MDMGKLENEDKKRKMSADSDRDVFDALTMDSTYVESSPPSNTRNRASIDVTMSDIEELLGLKKGSILYLQSDNRQEKVSINHSDVNKGAKPVGEGERFPKTTWKDLNKPEASYNGFSGVDMIAEINGMEVGILQGFNYSFSKEMAPIYPYKADPRAFQRGKRGINGSLMFNDLYKGNIKEAIAFRKDNVHDPRPWYPDQMPPIDIVLTSANEYGNKLRMEFKGVEIMDKGYGIATDDIIPFQSYTYIAKEMNNWEPIDRFTKEEYDSFPDDIIKKGSFIDIKYKMTILKSNLFTELEDSAGIKCTEELEEDHTGQIYNPHTDTWSFL